MKYFAGILGLLLMFLGVGFLYSPSHFDARLQIYVQEDIIDKNRTARTDDAKIATRKKIVESSKDLPERLARHMEQVLAYRDEKASDAPTLIDLSRIEVVEDGKGALNMRSGPSSNYEILGKLPEGSTAKVLLEMNGRYQIEQDEFDKDPRVMKKYVTSIDEPKQEDIIPVKPIPIISAPTGETVIKTIEVSPNDAGSLRVRDDATSTAGVLGTVAVGFVADVYEEKNGYFRIKREDGYAWIAVNFVHLSGSAAPTHHLTKPTVALSNTTVSANKQEFLDTYRGLVDSSNTALQPLCTEYYDQIDAVAREYDFPVELIIAIRHREHTCKFKNPGNGRGNFQITSKYYPPGAISRSQFENQIIDFIAFSREKRKYYDLTQNFGPAPISLSYDSFDLASIRKHSIYYNGVVGTLENNVYTNQNFNGVRVGGTDGIVASFLKVLKYGLER